MDVPPNMSLSQWAPGICVDNKRRRQALQLLLIFFLLELFIFMKLVYKSSSVSQEFVQPEEMVQHILKREQNENILLSSNGTSRKERDMVTRLEQKRNKKAQQVARVGPATSKLPLPIFVASLPKSATSSSYVYFKCGGYKSGHQWIKGGGKIGACFESNVQNGRPPFEGCGEYDVWSDTGYMEKNYVCYQPAVQGLDAIYQAYPNATFVLVTRQTEAWFGSLYRLEWLMTFNKLHNCPGMPNKGATKEDWLQFYENHTQTVRAFAKAHPSITYLEFAVEDPEAASKMEAATGVNATCWGRKGQTRTGGGHPKDPSLLTLNLVAGDKKTNDTFPK